MDLIPSDLYSRVRWVFTLLTTYNLAEKIDFREAALATLW